MVYQTPIGVMERGKMSLPAGLVGRPAESPKERKVVFCTKLHAHGMAGLRYELINNFGSQVAKGILLRLGQRCGREAAKASESGRRSTGLGSCRSVLERGLKDLGVIAHFRLSKANSTHQGSSGKSKLFGSVTDCQEAMSHYQLCGCSNEPCCWMTSGFVGGFVSQWMGEDYLCLETACASVQGNQCEFEVRLQSEWGERAEPTLKAMANQHFIENFSCGQDFKNCGIQRALQSSDDQGLKSELERCMLHVDRFGQHLQVEAERRERELTKRDDFLANILRESADAIITIDLNDCIISWNKGAESIYGYSEAEVLGKNIELMVPQELTKSRELELIRRKLEKEGVVRNFKTQRVTKSGRKIDVIVTRTPIHNAYGEVIGSSAIVKDVTQLRKIENQLSRAEHLASMGELAAALAHEIKNPLAGVKGAIEVILDQYDSRQPHHEILVDVMQEVKRIDRIVQDLLGYARPKDPHVSKINIRDVFRRVSLLFDRTIEQKNIHLELNVDDDGEVIYADENLFEQVMLNLVLNALQALPDGGTLILSTRHTRDISGVEITVQDNGPGILPEDQARVFQPFFTTKKGGTGLGLATCKRIITDHGGSLTVSSVPGLGATFRIWLPERQA